MMVKTLSIAVVAGLLTIGVTASAQNKPAKPAAASTTDAGVKKVHKHRVHHRHHKAAATDNSGK